MAPKRSIRKYLILLDGIFQSLFRKNVGLWPILGTFQNNESVTRFLLADDIRSSDGTIKHKAFIPPTGIPDLSVYRIIDLSSTTIWRIGKFLVERYRKKPIIGRADISIKIIKEAFPTLYLKRTYIPHPRHANIKGFPVVPHPDQEQNEAVRQTQKQRQKAISIELAVQANPPIKR